MKIKLLKCNGIVFKRGLDGLGQKAAVSTVASTSKSLHLPVVRLSYNNPMFLTLFALGT